MASARLRKAFRYPVDSSDDDAREELDEEGLLKSSCTSLTLTLVPRTRTRY
jgi:hypothetical protein